MSRTAKTIDEFYDIIVQETNYPHSEYHYLPKMFSILMEDNNVGLVIAKGKTRNNIMTRMSNLREFVEDHIWYEPNYNFLRHNSNKSTIKFATTGFHGGYAKIKKVPNLKHILLHGFVPGDQQWEMLYKAAIERIDVKDGNVWVQNA